MLPKINPTTTEAWEKLLQHYTSQDYRLQKAQPEEFKKTIEALFQVDYQYGLWNTTTVALLLQLAKETQLEQAIEALFTGVKINETEDRAVLHTALRDGSQQPIYVNKENIQPKVEKELSKMKEFVEQVHEGKVVGSTGKKIKHIVNIGIGGSAIGPRMVIEALECYRNSDIQVHFVSSIDAEPILSLLEEIDLEASLFLVVSKTFTTLETMTNARYIKQYVIGRLGQEHWQKHFVGITASPETALEFGISKSHLFEFWDWVCGRFSLWSSVGLSIALAIGYEEYENLLKGAEKMDQHFRTVEWKDNLPILHALLGIWYTNFHGCQTQAIIPYNHCLRELKLYLQQAAMESNGKSVDRTGKPIDYATCPVIWGEVGNDAQHSFFQLLHQGMVKIPSDFILIEDHNHDCDEHHGHLIANYHAQIKALTQGRDLEATLAHLGPSKMDIQHRVFAGKKPVTPILLKELTPESLGALLAMYEHTYFVQGIIWNVYSFDQWGVELGKTLAKEGMVNSE